MLRRLPKHSKNRCEIYLVPFIIRYSNAKVLRDVACRTLPVANILHHIESILIHRVAAVSPTNLLYFLIFFVPLMDNMIHLFLLCSSSLVFFFLLCSPPITCPLPLENQNICYCRLILLHMSRRPASSPFRLPSTNQQGVS